MLSPVRSEKSVGTQTPTNDDDNNYPAVHTSSGKYDDNVSVSESPSESQRTLRVPQGTCFLLDGLMINI